MSDEKLPPRIPGLFRKFPDNTPRWVIVLCCVVSGVVVPGLIAFSPHISELIESATEAKKAQAENERTALATVLDLVNTNTKQVNSLATALEAEQKEKRALTDRVTELERVSRQTSTALEDCQGKLKNCK